MTITWGAGLCSDRDHLSVDKCALGGKWSKSDIFLSSGRLVFGFLSQGPAARDFIPEADPNTRPERPLRPWPRRTGRMTGSVSRKRARTLVPMQDREATRAGVRRQARGRDAGRLRGGRAGPVIGSFNYCGVRMCCAFISCCSGFLFLPLPTRPVRGCRNCINGASGVTHLPPWLQGIIAPSSLPLSSCGWPSGGYLSSAAWLECSRLLEFIIQFVRKS